MSEQAEPTRKLSFARVFSDPDVSPFDQVEWVERTAAIQDSKGNDVFRQSGGEFPEFYSQLAVNVVASKYFYGDTKNGNGSPADGKREYSLRQLIRRVADTIAAWGVMDAYFDREAAGVFRDELTWLLLNQHGSFNSPVWFNLGLWHEYEIAGDAVAWRWDDAARRIVPLAPGEGYRHPQISACYIQGVEDTMDSIMDLAKAEAMLFKGGSGTGTDLTPLRSTKEKLTGGGKPSGPVSFFRVFDTIAGIIKSGGKTRRAARMNTLMCDHPDVLDFAVCKVKEDRKARTLIAAGYSDGLTGDADEAYSSVAFQNTNISMRARDSFMRKAVGDDPDPMYWTRGVDGRPIERLDARAVLDTIAESTWECGDPGMQFHDTLNAWHTAPNTAELRSSNPCGEYNYINDSACNLASLNLMKFVGAGGEFDAARFEAAVRIFIVAQEILVDRANYPTEKIARNSHDYRPLGLGYANLGALLMASGLPYDSDEGRSYAGAVTALMQGRANHTSAELASVHGPFAGFAKNAEPMLAVMQKHYAAAVAGAASAPAAGGTALRRLWDRACAVWKDKTLPAGASYGYRNGQVTVIAPTGCATGDTLVLTDRGLRRLRSLGDVAGAQWQGVSFSVRTPDGVRRAEKFYVNGPARVVRMTSERGYRFHATARHQVKVIADGEWVWRRMSSLQPGDVVPLQLGGMIGSPIDVALPPLSRLDPRATPIIAPALMTPQLAELIGAFMANGSTHTKGLRISVHRADTELAARTVRMFADLFELEAIVEPDSHEADCVAVVATSTPLRRWWESAGFAKLKPTPDHRGKGYKPRVPDAVLATNDPLAYAAFIRGFIDHDGGAASGLPEFLNTSRDIIADLKVMCLALGFPTALRETRCGLSGSSMWRARLLNKAYASRWMELIGFTESRKRDAVVECTGTGRNDYVYIPVEVFDRVCPLHHASRFSAFSSTRRATAVAVDKSAVRAVPRTTAQELYRETGDADLLHHLQFFYDKVAAVEESATEESTYDLAVPSNVTWTGGGFVSHNTIAFFMDCDTTGLEPDLALVKYKKLAGGGQLKIVNQAVPSALQKLGYSHDPVYMVRGETGSRAVVDDRIASMIRWIEANGSLEGCPLVDEGHLPVFDCAFPVSPGGRAIHWEGHVKMMASIQPFISGALSKSVNLPNAATVADIRDAYILGWRLGLKSMAIYRDGSKGVQPLNTKEEKNEQAAGDGEPVVGAEKRSAAASSTPALPQTAPVAAVPPCGPCRERLPDTRNSLTHKLSVGGHEGYATVGLYPDGRPGELFVTMAKEGSTIGGLMDVLGASISIGLQYGVPLDVFVNKFAHTRFEPSGFTKNGDVPMAASIVDYIFRWMGMEFIDGYREANSPAYRHALEQAAREAEDAGAAEAVRASTSDPTPRPVAASTDAPLCDVCGSLTIRSGTCHRCPNCGSSMGCS